MRVKLGEVCEILNGYAFKSEMYVEEGIRIIRIANVQNGYIEDSTPVFYPVDDADVAKYLLHADDLLMSLTGNVGRVALLDKCFLPASLNQRVACLRIKNVSVLNKKYLFSFLNSSKFENECVQSSRGVAQKNMSTEWLKDYSILIPSIEEQRKIAAVLDKVSGLIAIRKKQLQKLDDLVKSRFVEMFGGECENRIPLKDCCIDVRGGSTPSMQHPEYYGGNVPFIKSGDVRGDTVMTGALWLTEQALTDTPAKYVPQGSILVVNRSAALLREFRAAIALQPVVINQDIKAFIPKPSFSSEYLLWAIKIQTKYLLTRVTTVLTSHIDLKDLLELPIAPVSIEKQQQFCAFTTRINTVKMTIQQSLDKLELTKKALMQKYFG